MTQMGTGVIPKQGFLLVGISGQTGVQRDLFHYPKSALKQALKSSLVSATKDSEYPALLDSNGRNLLVEGGTTFLQRC